MKTILLLLLCLPAYAALPPMPAIPTVKRPAPLLSPKAASASKSKPMTKLTVAGESTVSTLAPFWMSYTKDQFFFDSIVDIMHVQAIQRAGKGVRFEYKDSVASSGWAFMADWTPYPEEQVVQTEWYHSTDQRVQARFFRVVEYTAPALLSESGNWVLAGSRPLYRTNPALKIRTWRTPR